MSRRFDAIVIGTGQAGPPLAERLTRAGMSVAIIERHLFGGTCVNTGCTPTKAMVASAYAAHMARRAGDFGVAVAGAVTVDMAQVSARANTIAGKSRSGVEKWLRGLDGCTVITGHARFTGPRTVEVNREVLEAPRVFVNVGARATVPEMPGLGDVPCYTNGPILKVAVAPRHLVVVGGSYVGLEFAQMFRRFGSEVTVVEKAPRLISKEDEDVSDAIRGILQAEGIECRFGAECIRFERRGGEVVVGVDCEEGPPEVVGSDVLLAVGRTPNTDDLGLESAGIDTDDRGHIRVDDALATSVEGVWALGDCNGRGAFTHTSYNDYEIVAANLLDGEDRRVSDRILAYALYIDPPLGRVGMSEEAARESGRDVLVAKRPMSRVSRAVEKGETEGFMKIVADAGTQEILGAAILGTGGDEVVHGIIDAMNLGATYPRLQWAVPIHPTVSELIPTVLGSLEPIS